jgi:surfeit locus 1 family protein
LLFPVLISFGLWQLSREQEKLVLQERFDERSNAPWIDLASAENNQEALSYRRVVVRGSFDTQRSFLLDNRLNQGIPGYEVLTPFLTNEGLTVLVNRGWIAQGQRRDLLPSLPPVADITQVRGSIYVPVGEQFVLSDQREAGADLWPRVIQRVDMALLSDELGLEVFPYTLRIETGAPGALLAEWPLLNMMPEKHRGYAVQWFAMAAALLMLFIYSTIRHPERHDDPGSASDTNAHNAKENKSQ